MLGQMAPPLDLERCYDEHAPALFGFLLNLTRSETDTRDLLQDLFVKLARQPQLLSSAREPRAFLLRLSHHAAIDLMRRRRSREKYHDQLAQETLELFSLSADPDQDSFQRALTEALGELPAEQRVVVHLKLWEGQTFETIAGTLGISPNTAASRYRYGIDKLRQRLRPFYDEIK